MRFVSTREMARGLADLSKTAEDPTTKAELKALHDSLVVDFLAKAQQHFEKQKKIEARPSDNSSSYRRRAFFGMLWSALAILFAFFATTAVFGGLIAPFAAAGDDRIGVDWSALGPVFVAMIVVNGVAMLLFRWLAFMSARWGANPTGQSAEAAVATRDGA